MQKRLLITLLTLLLIIILTFTVHIQLVDASVVTLTMNTLPENQDWTVYKHGNVSSSVSNGILTIETNANYGEVIYYSPNDWKNTVNNTKGWIIEFRMKIDPTATTNIVGAKFLAPFLIQIDDDKSYTGISIHKDEIISTYPRMIEYFMDTTDTFHVYRIEEQAGIAKLFVDGKLVIETLTILDETEFQRIVFGTNDGRDGGQPNRFYLDYFSYDTNPTNLTLTSSTLTVIDGTSSYYISNLTDVTVDNSIVSIPNGIYAGWCVDKAFVMVRNEAHKITLYSTINTPLPYDINRFNWSSVNYILNHKQGSMQEIQDAIWYFVPDYSRPSINETNTWNMINDAKANSNYVPSKGDIMAIIAYAGHFSSASTRGTGVQNTILEYRIP